MTTQPMTKTRRNALLMALGAGLLVLPFAMPQEAKADDLRISLNLGGVPAYQPTVERVVYRPAPERVVYVPAPARVVYVSRPAYAPPVTRERVVYRDYRGHGRDRHERYDRWDGRGDRVAWR